MRDFADAHAQVHTASTSRLPRRARSPVPSPRARTSLGAAHHARLNQTGPEGHLDLDRAALKASESAAGHEFKLARAHEPAGLCIPLASIPINPGQLQVKGAQGRTRTAGARGGFVATYNIRRGHYPGGFTTGTPIDDFHLHVPGSSGPRALPIHAGLGPP